MRSQEKKGKAYLLDIDSGNTKKRGCPNK